MVDRVILGGSAHARRLATALEGRDGRTLTVVDDELAAQRLREADLATVVADVGDADALASVAADPRQAIVALGATETDAGRREACARAYPRAFRAMVCEGRYRGPEKGVHTVIELPRLAAAAVVETVLDPAFPGTAGLLGTLRHLDDPVAVVMHDNPDPDAIGAAVGVERLAEAVGREAAPLYAGEITHQQNRALVNLLELSLSTYDGDVDLEGYGGVVLVDHAHPNVNDQLPPGTAIDVVIDHHPAREEATAAFVDRRDDVGATSTLVADHLLRAGLTPSSTLATALWFGIQVDTDGFSRGFSDLDLTVGARLRGDVDESILQQLVSPRLSVRTVETLATAIENRSVHDDVLLSYIGEIAERDALSQASDALLAMHGVDVVCVYGRLEDRIIASARSNHEQVHVGDAIRHAFGQVGSAGGHEDMAGAQIPVGMLLEEAETPMADVLTSVVTARFLEGLEIAGRPLPSGFMDDGSDGPRGWSFVSE